MLGAAGIVGTAVLGSGTAGAATGAAVFTGVVAASGVSVAILFSYFLYFCIFNKPF
jgi:hypothetical protein